MGKGERQVFEGTSSCHLSLHREVLYREPVALQLHRKADLKHAVSAEHVYRSCDENTPTLSTYTTSIAVDQNGAQEGVMAMPIILYDVFLGKPKHTLNLQGQVFVSTYLLSYTV